MGKLLYEIVQGLIKIWAKLLRYRGKTIVILSKFALLKTGFDNFALTKSWKEHWLDSTKTYELVFINL